MNKILFNNVSAESQKVFKTCYAHILMQIFRYLCLYVYINFGLC